MKLQFFLLKGLFCFLFVLITMGVKGQAPLLNPDHPIRIPETVDGRLIPRELGCWFPRGFETEKPEGYKSFIDAIGQQASFDMIAVSNRLPSYESLSPEGIKFQKDAAVYSWNKYGIRMLPDAEIRLSRKEFKKRYPNSLQEVLVLREGCQTANNNLEISTSQSNRTDHYTHNYKYNVESVRLVRVWSYQKNSSGEIIPNSIKEITSEVVFSSKRSDNTLAAITLISGETVPKNRWICTATAYSFLYPDLHSEEALAFEKEIFEAHKDLPAGGCVKDEWGFLPNYQGVPNNDEYYFSKSMAARYQKITGRDLVDDAFLMFQPQSGKKKNRIQAIDDFNKMNLERCLKFEYQLYELTKNFWGPNAFPATHPTWYCKPIAQEFKKNSLMWWRHPRDYAQTDEDAPYPCRTGTSKTNGHLWYNEYYSNKIEPYFIEHWSNLLSGGRVNIHPFCCQPNNPLRTPDNFATLPILNKGAERIRQKIRMLNFISDKPLYCPVALVFGHFGVMNWARSEYNSMLTSALPLCQQFSMAGFPTDMIPSSQINEKNLAGSPCWKLNEDGLLQYGIQPYKVIVYYAVTQSDQADFDKLTALNKNGKTKIVAPDRIPEMIRSLKKEKTPEQSPWRDRPDMSGFARLVDGTCIWAAASLLSPTGKDLKISDASLGIQAEAQGVLACRFDDNGNLTALAASELKYFSGGGLCLKISENERPDLALWKDSSGKWKGILQAKKNVIPAELLKITNDWRYLMIK